MDKTSEMNKTIETIRRKVEHFEENPDNQIEEWKECLDQLGDLFKDVARENIFSVNEEFKDIKPEDLKYLLIPYYQAELIQKFVNNRAGNLKLALKFYDEFFNILKIYNYLTKERIKAYKALTVKDEDPEAKKKMPSFEEQSLQRQEKINLYKQKKALSEQIKKHEKDQDYDGNRDYWIAYIELCWFKMMDNLKFISMELESLSFKEEVENDPELKAKLEKEREESKGKKMEFINIPNQKSLETMNFDINNKLLKNVQLTNQQQLMENKDILNNLQIMSIDDRIKAQQDTRDKVFTNRNMPTMTLDEFADKQIKLMEEDKRKQKEWEEANRVDPEDEDKDLHVDNQNRADREWDDWKDMHEKGSGNKLGR